MSAFPEMNIYLEKAKSCIRDPEARRYIAAGTVILLSLIYVFSAILPASREFVEFSSRVRELERKRDVLNRRIKGLSQMKRKLASMKEEDRLYREQLPYQKDFPELLDRLASVAKGSGVTIYSIVPGKLSGVKDKGGENAYFMAMPVTISAKSGYHQLGKFISELETANRFISLESLSVKSNRQTPRWHDVRISLQTYVSIEDEKKD